MAEHVLPTTCEPLPSSTQVRWPRHEVERELVCDWEVEPLLRHAGFHVDLVSYTNHRDVRTSASFSRRMRVPTSVTPVLRAIISNFFVPPQRNKHKRA